MKKRKFSTQKEMERNRRTSELNQYRKLVSLRPSSVHESKKKYKRCKKVEIDENN